MALHNPTQEWGRRWVVTRSALGPGKCKCALLPRFTLELVRIAIDIRRINEFGVGTYTRNAIRTLARLDQENEYFLIGIPGKLPGTEGLPANFKTLPAQPNEFSLSSYFELHRLLKRFHCNLLHVPHLFWKPQGIPCPYVVTVHDLLDHLYRVDSHSTLKRDLHFRFTKRVLQRAARIFAVSNFSKQDTERLFRVPPEKIEVIYNAIDERFRQGHASAAEREFIAERYQVNRSEERRVGKECRSRWSPYH